MRMPSTIRPRLPELPPPPGAGERLTDGGGALPTRRDFLVRSAGLGAAALLLSSCTDVDPTADEEVASLGTGNVAVLNYALVLEELEAAFYTRAAGSPYGGISQMERRLLDDLRDHEVAHRDFLRAALGTAAVSALEFDFGAVDFGSRASVLSAAQTFEDLGVAAYNGAGRLLSRDAEGAALLLVAGKIVSVEARHAAAIRSLRSSDRRAFAGDDVVDPGGLDRILRPAEVLAAASPFLRTPVDASGLPA